MTHLSLFTGIGGIDLAAEWAGFETVGQVEWADYPTKILEKHWVDVPRWRDIRSVTKESFYERTGLRTVDLVSGGFPCQPFSVAGNQKGKGDERYLWPEMLRVIRETAPRWVIGENVSGILPIAGKTVCEDLEREGYAVAIFNYEAAAVGAKHRRERVFFVAERSAALENARHGGCKQPGVLQEQPRRTESIGAGQGVPDGEPAEMRENVANAESKQSKPDINREVRAEEQIKFRGGCGGFGGNWWVTEPNVGRVANGIPNRVDRLKCLGNAVVPQQIYPILRAIADVESNK